MSGCPSTVGKQGRIARHMGRRVDCMMGLCKPIRYHEVIWPRTRMRNQPPFCKAHATKCQAAAGGVGTDHNIPYYRIPKEGESGCSPLLDLSNALHLVAALFDIVGPDHDLVGYSSGPPLEVVGPEYPAAGSLTPSSRNGTTILGVWTHDLPPHQTPPQQINIALSGVIPTSITFTGGDLDRSYTLKTSEANYAPTTNPAIWNWLNQGFYLTPGVGYTIFFD